MTDYVEFSEFITKGMEIEKGNERRIFKGHITAEIIDKQQEFIFVKEVMKIMETFMSVNPVISDYHSNRMVGKVLDYEQSEYNGVATVLITAEVYKKDGITLYDKIWKKVLSGEYAGLSMGGASKEREPMVKDGKIALELRKLELYEIALCDTPANPFAVIEKVNQFAKSTGLDSSMIKDLNGREQIRCTTLGCKFEKGTNVDDDKDVDNKLEQFDKPEDNPEDVEKLDPKTLVGRSAETRSENVGGATGSPKETGDIINQIPKMKQKKPFNTLGLKKDHIPSTPEHIEEEARAKIKGEKAGERTIVKDETVPEDSSLNKFESPSSLAGAKKQSKIEGNMVHETSERRVKDISKVETPYELILKFGIPIVKHALEEAETMEYLKQLTKKYKK